MHNVDFFNVTDSGKQSYYCASTHESVSSVAHMNFFRQLALVKIGLNLQRSHRFFSFRHPSRWALGPNEPLVSWVLGLFPWDKTAGAWRWPPTSSSAL